MVSIGHEARVGIGTTSGSAATNELDVRSCSIGKTQEFARNDGIRGSRFRIEEDMNFGTYAVGGTILMDPRPDDLDLLLPWILGGTETADSFPLAEDVAIYGVDVEKVANAYRYTLMSVNTATFRSSAGQPLELELDVQGAAESTITFPSIAATLTDKRPYMHHQLTLTLNGTAYNATDVEIAIDNALLLDRFFNSETRTALPGSDLNINLRATVPFTSTEETAFYDLAIGGFTGTNTAVWTDGTNTLTFTFAVLQLATQPVVISARTEEILMGLDFVVNRDDSGGTNQLVVTSTNA